MNVPEFLVRKILIAALFYGSYAFAVQESYGDSSGWWSYSPQQNEISRSFRSNYVALKELKKKPASSTLYERVKPPSALAPICEICDGVNGGFFYRGGNRYECRHLLARRWEEAYRKEEGDVSVKSVFISFILKCLCLGG